MILCLDAGNTRLKWGLFDAQMNPSAGGALAYTALDQLDTPVAELAVLANVAGADIGERIAALLSRTGIPLHRAVAVASQCGVTNGYDVPAQLGVDRWAALIGARGRQPGPCLVVMAGTATTVDLLDAGGIFRGGLILPGLDLMRTSLTRNTAQLGPAAGEFRGLPTNTADAIMSGCLHAQAGAIERQFARIAREPDALCLLGGGAAPALAPLLSIPFLRVDTLVLEGLARIGRGVMGLPQVGRAHPGA